MLRGILSAEHDGAESARHATGAWLAAAVWMGLAYYIWLVERAIHGQYSLPAISAVVVGFGPLLVWSVINYRVGVFATLLTLPFFQAPDVPHFFTQGFGDLFAVATICGFVLRQPRILRIFRELWDPRYVWLCVLVVAALVSLALAYRTTSDPGWTLRYGLADVGGLLVDIGFMAILANISRSDHHRRMAVKAIVIGLGAVLVFGVMGAYEIIGCRGGFFSSGVASDHQRIVATFGSTSVFAGYAVSLLPVALWLYTDEARSAGWKRWTVGAAVVSILIMTLTTMSRAGLLGLVVVWLLWGLGGRDWRRNPVFVLAGLTLLLAPVIWSSWGCVCRDKPYFSCHFARLDVSGLVNFREFKLPTLEGVFGRNLHSPVRVELSEQALHVLSEQPLSGVGMGQTPRYMENRAHNTALTVMLETGPIGAFAFLGWCGHLLVRLWKTRGDPGVRDTGSHWLLLALAGALTVALFHDSLRSLWMWTVFGLAVSATRHAGKSGESKAVS